jgi:heavy metal translocating P-type ATPase
MQEATVEPMIQATYRIKHELPQRLRVQIPILHDPSFDRAYLEASLGAMEGVEKVRINPGSASLIIHYDGDRQTREKLLRNLTRFSEECFKPDTRHIPPLSGSDVAVKLVSALLIPRLSKRFQAPLSWLLALPVMSEGVVKTLSRGVKVETLDAIAVFLSLLRKEYFTAGMIGGLLALGKYLEQLTEAQTTRLLQDLLQPRIGSVRVEREGTEIRVPLDQVRLGDFVICGAGEMIAVDGTILSGVAALNQSSITGEALPVQVQPGNAVLSGAIVEDGRIVISAEKVGQETTIARISSFLVNSLRTKSPVQKRSDELADSLVPISFALGLGIQLITRDIKRTASVFTVDYSCAIKLANPIVVKMAMFHAAQHGVLLKGAGAIDLLSRVDTIVFDKTGTLTKGRMIVSELQPVGNMTPDRLLTLAAAAEEHYTHPVATAVVRAAVERNLELPPLSQVEFVVAHGVSAYVDGKRILVGSHHFVAEDEGVDCSAVAEFAARILKDGKSPLYVAEENRLAGVIALEDELRSEAPDVLSRLKRSGIRQIIVLSGDRKEVVASLGRRIEAVDRLHWELKPEQKALIVKAMAEEGRCIAFAGDGVNDSPALLTAQVGICMPDGADLAKESAQVVLMKDSLEALAVARELAIDTQKIIKNCFNASIAVNSALLLGATAGRLPPVASALLHNLNTIGVLSYAALAHRWYTYESHT